MCGIAGQISSHPGFLSTEKFKSAVDCLQHRGPESGDTWVNKSNTAALGHRRLSIIDLSREAAQPMHYGDRYTIVYNGELYNYIEIRNQLQQKGYAFRTQSDTEVLVAAFDAYGSDCVQQFDGMFAFAIWDEEQQKLFAARDRFGEKPFFFYYDKERLTFGSEMKALWELGIKKEVNKSMLYNFLTIGYTGNPADPKETFYEGIYKLPSASHLTFHAGTKELTIKKYWQLFVEENTAITEPAAIEQFTSLFSASIKKRLRSDVAIGTSLSGGLDSSAIVSFCADEQTSRYTHKCFTASFTDFEKDEFRFADLVARKYNLQHYKVEMDEPDIVPLMNEVMHYQEEPVGSASALAQYNVYHLAKENGVTVLLDGQGADEVLAGYHKYFKWHWQDLYRKRKLAKSGEWKEAQNLGVPETFALKNKAAALFPELAASLLQSRKAKEAFQHGDLNRDFAFEQKRNLYYSTPATFDLNGALYFNTFVNGLEELLRVADRNSMAHGTEVRLPFLSHELVKFLFSLPPGYKIHGGWTKWLLRKATEKDLPSEIVWRRDKTGFEPPQKRWMENKNVQDAIRDAKRMLFENGILNENAVRKKIKPHEAHAASNWDWRYWSSSYLF